MGELNRHVGHETQILFGTSVDGRMGNRLSVTIISSLASDGEEVVQPVAQRPAVAAPVAPPIAKKKPLPEPAPAEGLNAPAPPELERPLQMIEAVLPSPNDEDESLASYPVEEEIAEPPQAEAPPPPQTTPEMIEPEPTQPRVILPKKKPIPAVPREPKPTERLVAKQEVMQFESVTRGRFEKSEPTIVEGQDLDVPTFLRKNVRVK